MADTVEPGLGVEGVGGVAHGAPRDHSVEEVEQAIALAKQIDAKATDALEPPEREMRILGYKPEHRAIIWNTVARKAMNRAMEAERG